MRRDHEIALDVLPTPRTARPGIPATIASRTPRSAAGKVLLEEITEAGAFELEFFPARHRTAGGRPTTARRGWSLPVPVRAERIVFLPFLRITEHLVGLIDLFKFLLRRGLVFRHIRMMDASQLAERLLHIHLRGIALDAQHFIVIPEFYSHISDIFSIKLADSPAFV